MYLRILLISFFVLFLSGTARTQDIKGYGAVLPSEEELKRFPYVPAFSLPPNITLPKSITNLAPLMPPVGDQGIQGSCVAFATVYALKSYQERVQNNNWQLEENGIPRWDRICSPAYVFNKGKNGHPNCSSGITFTRTFEILKVSGTVFWELYPYSELNCNPPTQKLDEAAKTNRIITEATANYKDLDEIKYNLYLGLPIVIGIMVYPEFQQKGFDAFTAHTRYTFQPPAGSLLSKYHAMLCVGYDNDTNSFQVLNSWGPSWGNNGYVDIPYSWFTSAVQEAYTVVDMRPAALALEANQEQREPSDTDSTENKLITWFKVGYYRDFKNLRIGLVDLLENENSIVVTYTDMRTRKELNTVKYALKTPTTFYYEDRKLTFTLESIRRAGRNPLNKAAYFTLNVDKTVDKAFLDRVSSIRLFDAQLNLLNEMKQAQDQQLNKN